MFLKPQDLRIGNYINYEFTTHVVAELHEDKLIHHWRNSMVDGYVTKYYQILSIPLTHTELEKLGFEEKEKGYFRDSNFFLAEIGEDFWLCELIEGNKVVRFAKVDFVHELQNMFYFFTKQELKYID
jgi:hypothetical protein